LWTLSFYCNGYGLRVSRVCRLGLRLGLGLELGLSNLSLGLVIELA